MDNIIELPIRRLKTLCSHQNSTFHPQNQQAERVKIQLIPAAVSAPRKPPEEIRVIKFSLITPAMTPANFLRFSISLGGKSLARRLRNSFSLINSLRKKKDEGKHFPNSLF
jgi:hypothetical protein